MKYKPELENLVAVHQKCRFNLFCNFFLFRMKQRELPDFLSTMYQFYMMFVMYHT